MMTDPCAPVLRLHELSKSFGDVKAVDRLSLEVRRGEIFGLLGPNGAGKTTTIRMMCGLLRPDAGRVEVDGRLASPAPAEVRRAIGLSPQNIMIWEALTCREQLEFMGRMYGLDGASTRRRTRELLAAFGLEDKRNKLGRTLSGGLKRRLNIALALVHEPEILFLDEPQAGLDPQSRVLVREYVRSLARRATVILTTHDMEEAEKLSDRICIIDHGRLLELGTVAEVKSRLGRGDLIELEIAEDIAAVLLPHVPALGRAQGRAVVRDNTLILVSEEAAGLLPDVLGVIRDRGLKLVNLRLRQKTLEDVFIHLTGRGLRE
jgi:ABC-2 type transport system ATP-binding protein